MVRKKGPVSTLCLEQKGFDCVCCIVKNCRFYIKWLTVPPWGLGPGRLAPAHKALVALSHLELRMLGDRPCGTLYGGHFKCVAGSALLRATSPSALQLLQCLLYNQCSVATTGQQVLRHFVEACVKDPLVDLLE